MKRTLTAAAVSALLAILLMASGAVAQPTAIEASKKVKIAGLSVRCQDFRGKPVTTLKVDELGDVGRAWVVNMTPFIVMDSHMLLQLPVKLQLFFYAHECAHHVLGHWYTPSVNNEIEADCWAIRYGRDTGLFRRQEVADFAPWLAASKGSRFGHLPGPRRAQSLLECFDNAEPLLLSSEQKTMFVR